MESSRGAAGPRSGRPAPAALAVAAVLLLGGCALLGRDSIVPGESRTGRASWYGAAHRGRTTASGERFDDGAYTAAHRTLPFGTRLRVTNPRNGKSVVVRVNDRGPYVPGRILDLSHAAARALGIAGHGVAEVRIERLR